MADMLSGASQYQGSGGTANVYQLMEPAIHSLAGQADLQAALGNFATQFANYVQGQQQMLQDKTLANLNRAGIAGDVTGQDVLARGLGSLTGTLLPQFSQQALGVTQFSVDLLNKLQEAQRMREYQWNEFNNKLRFEAEVLRNQLVNYPLEVLEKRIPIDVKAFHAGAQAQKQEFPDQNGSIQSLLSQFSGGGGGGGGVIGGDFGTPTPSFEDMQKINRKPWDDPTWVSSLNPNVVNSATTSPRAIPSDTWSSPSNPNYVPRTGDYTPLRR